MQIPYQRGSPGTETIPEYPGYPANLEQYLSNQTIPIQAFNTLNIARDVIASIKGEQTRDPSVAHYAVGFSYGSQLLNQILLLEPALFKTAIFDGSMVRAKTWLSPAEIVGSLTKDPASNWRR